MTTQEVLQHFQNVKRTGNNQYSALCPAHDDHTASLCIGTGDDGRTLVTCQRGCSLDDILSAVGLKKSDLFATPLEQKQNKPWKYICSYYYPDRNGRPRNRKDRYIKPDGKKTFIWKHYDGKQWVKHKTNGDPGLYNADCISSNDLIYIVEGEKDVETLKACGRAAVCSPHGAKQNGEAWKPEYTEALKGKSVVVIQDNDETGKAFSSIICNALSGQVESVKLVDLCKLYPALKEHGDITDLCEINGNSNVIIEAVEAMAAGLPEYQKNSSVTSVTCHTGEVSENKMGFAIFEPFAIRGRDKLPLFPTDRLPAVLKEYIKDVARSYQVSEDMAAVLVLGVCSITLMGKYVIQSKKDWKEHLNLYVTIIAPPSEKKSPIMAEVTKPVYDYEEAENILNETEIKRYQSKERILSARVKQLEEQAVKGKATEEQVFQAVEELEELRKNPVLPLRLITTDTTPEALISTMEKNNGKMAIVSAEGGIFDIMAGMYSTSGNSNIDVFLQSFNGEPIRIDRKLGGSIFMKRPLLCIVLAVQPIVIGKIQENETLKGRGLLTRFLYSLPPSLVGKRKYRVEPVSDEHREEYTKLIQTLLSIDTPAEPEVLTLSEGADEEAEAFHNWLEPQLPDDLEDIGEWCGKFQGQIFRIAGILHCVKYKGNAGLIPIERGTIQNAIEIGKYFLEHEKVASNMLGASDPEDVRNAKYILRRIADNGNVDISKRDLFQLCNGKFETVSDMETPLSILEERGYLKLQKLQNLQNSKRGRPSVMIKLNPEYLEYLKENER